MRKKSTIMFDDLILLSIQLPLSVLTLYDVVYKLFGNTSDGVMAILASAMMIGGLGHSMYLKWRMDDEKLYTDIDNSKGGGKL